MTTEIDETSPDVEAESIGLIGAGLVYQALSARLVDMGYRVFAPQHGFIANWWSGNRFGSGVFDGIVRRSVCSREARAGHAGIDGGVAKPAGSGSSTHDCRHDCTGRFPRQSGRGRSTRRILCVARNWLPRCGPCGFQRTDSTGRCHCSRRWN